MADRGETPAPPVGDLQSPAESYLDAIISELLTAPNADLGLFTSSPEVATIVSSERSPPEVVGGEHVTSVDFASTLSDAAVRAAETVTESGMAPRSEHVTSGSSTTDVCGAPCRWPIVAADDAELTFVPTFSSDADEAARLGVTCLVDPEHLTIVPSTEVTDVSASAPTPTTPTPTAPLTSPPAAHSRPEASLRPTTLVTQTPEMLPNTLIQMEEAGLLPRGTASGEARPEVERRRPLRIRASASSTATSTSSSGRNMDVPVEVLYTETLGTTTQEDLRHFTSSETTRSSELDPLTSPVVTSPETLGSTAASVSPQRQPAGHVTLLSVGEVAARSTTSVAGRRQTTAGQRSSFIRGIRDVIVRYAGADAPRLPVERSSPPTVSHPSPHAHSPHHPHPHQDTRKRPSSPTAFVFPPKRPVSALSPHISLASVTSPSSSGTSSRTGEQTQGQGRSPSGSYVIERLHERLRRRRDVIVETEQAEPEERRNPPTLTPEEIAKKERRRAQNRRAAQRCREKKKQEADNVTKEFKKLQSDNTELRHEIRQLQNEKQILADVLQSHLVVCQKDDSPDIIVPSSASSTSSASLTSPPPRPPPPITSSSRVADVVIVTSYAEEGSQSDVTTDVISDDQ